MANTRMLVMKPSFWNVFNSLPGNQTNNLLEKIQYVLEDPFPDGKLKKKMKNEQNLYRLRYGKLRIFYSIEPDFITLYTIRRRDKAYRGTMPQAEELELPEDRSAVVEGLEYESEPEAEQKSQYEYAYDYDADGFDDDDEDEDDELESAREFKFKPDVSVAQVDTKLPRELTPEFLESIRIPSDAIPRLQVCRTEDELLEAGVSEVLISRVLEVLFPTSIEEVKRQPGFVVPQTQDLVHPDIQEGDLIGFLLQLDDDQRKLVSWAISGPTMVRGGAGTGKSTIALYRVKEVLEREGATGNETVLFTTYTKALTAVSERLLKQLLTKEQLKRVSIKTVDQIVYQIVSTKRPINNIQSDDDELKRLKRLRKGFVPPSTSSFDEKLRERALERLSDEYIMEEFQWIIEGRGLTTLEEYKDASRPGRGVPFNESLRETIWKLYEDFQKSMMEPTFHALRREALELVESGYYQQKWDYIFVDEAQDLSPTALKLLAELATSAEGLFFAADAKQSIYSKNYTWKAVHPRLRFRGRTSILRNNYRSTEEIDRAAFSILRPEDEEEFEESKSLHKGEKPILVQGVTPGEEGKWIARFIRQMAKHLHLSTNSAAVLVPNRVVGEKIATAVQNEGIEANFVAGRDIDLDSKKTTVMTLHSAKGLEYPIVVIAGFWEGTYPNARNFTEPGLFEERMREERRLLYVGMTRAMRGLMVVMPKDCEHQALLELNLDDWNVEKA